MDNGMRTIYFSLIENSVQFEILRNITVSKRKPEETTAETL